MGLSDGILVEIQPFGTFTLTPEQMPHTHPSPVGYLYDRAAEP